MSRASKSARSSKAFELGEKSSMRWKIATSAVWIFALARRGSLSLIACCKASCHRNAGMSCCITSTPAGSDSVGAYCADVNYHSYYR